MNERVLLREFVFGRARQMGQSVSGNNVSKTCTERVCVCVCILQTETTLYTRTRSYSQILHVGLKLPAFVAIAAVTS